MSTAPQLEKITAEEYFRITENREDRTELLDGQIFAMSSPSMIHQDIVGGIYAETRSFIRANKGDCKAMVSPFDVMFDDTNVVQPDVLVVCDPSKIDEKRCHGAPDWLVEVTSTNRMRDFCQKLWLYQRSGVREYWIVDTKYKRVHVYFFEDDESQQIYDFNTPIPVRIYDGKLTVRIADMV